MTINGWTVPVRNDSVRTERHEVGARGSSVGGVPFVDIQFEGDAWQFSTSPLSLQEARALKRLLAGQGHRWTFEDGGAGNAWKYATSGAVASALLNASRATDNPKFGIAQLSMSTGGYVSWDLDLSSWTAMVWRDTGAGFALYLETSGGLYYRGGSAVAQEDWFDVAAGVFSLYNDSGSTVDFDDLVVLPFDVSAGQAAAFSARTTEWPSPADLVMSGDIVGGETVYVRTNEPPTGSMVQRYIGGSWASNAEVVSATLVERPDPAASAVPTNSLDDPFGDWTWFYAADDITGSGPYSLAPVHGSGPTLANAGTLTTGVATAPLVASAIGATREDAMFIPGTDSFRASGGSIPFGDIHFRIVFQPNSETNKYLMTYVVNGAQLFQLKYASSTLLQVNWRNDALGAIYSANITVTNAAKHLLDIIIHPTGGASGFSAMEIYLNGAEVVVADHSAAITVATTGAIGIGVWGSSATNPCTSGILAAGCRPGAAGISLAVHQTHATAMGL